MNLLASLRYLVALDEHKHFGRAALACHITQPALSNALRALEQEFGTTIINRGRAYVGLTPEGERVLATAQRMMHERELLEQDLRGVASKPVGQHCHWRCANSRAHCSAVCRDAASQAPRHHADGAVDDV